MFDEATLKKLLLAMNQHLPKQRRPLSELLLEKEPRYYGKDGHSYRLDKSELVFIASLLDSLDKARLRLPILLMSDTSYEGGAWKVTGKVEARLISKILGREIDSEDEIRLYYPHLSEVRKKLPTTTTIMFMP